MKANLVNSESRKSQMFKDWWKTNWKKVAVGVIVIGGTILVVKNWNSIAAAVREFKVLVKPATKGPLTPEFPCVTGKALTPTAGLAKEVIRKSPEEPFGVSGHIRNLPKNWNASPEKIAEAAELQIALLPHQTLVDAYVKGHQAA